MSIHAKILLRPRTLRSFSLFTIILFGLISTLIAFRATLKWEQQKIQAGFHLAAEDRVAAFQREMDSNLETLLALKAFYSTSPGITRPQFRDFVAPLLFHHPSIQALEWIPLVTDSQRDAYEAAARREGFPDFVITERAAQKMMVRADKRKEYFPVYFVEPYEGNASALGFDLASNPARLEALKLSRENGEMVATSRVTLVQETGKQFGFLVFMPIYRNLSKNPIQENPENLNGFALGVFRIGDLLEKSLTYLKPLGINIYLYDKSAPEGESYLHFHQEGIKKAGSSVSAQGTDESKSVKPYELIKTFVFANRKWELRYAPTSDYIAARRTWQPWGVLLGGLLLTGFLSAYVVISRKRTAELLKSNEQLRLEIEQRERAEEEAKDLAKFPAENPDPVLRINREGRILYANNSSQEILKSWGCAVGDNAPPFWRQLITDTLQQGFKQVTEYNVRGKAYSLSVAPILAAGYVNLYGTNITGFKQAQEELKEYQKAIEGTQDMIAVINQECKYLIANGAFLRYRSLDKGQVVGRSASEVIGKDVFEGLIKGHLEACFQGQSIRYEMKHTYPELGERDLSVAYFPLAGPDGTINRVVSVIRDITEQKKGEEQLRQSEMRYRRLYESMTDGFVFITMDGMIKEYNRPFLKMVGYTSEEILRLTYKDLTSKKWHDFEQKVIEEQILPQGYSDVIEIEGRKKDGTEFPIELRAFLIKDDNGGNIGIWAIIRDISERKRTERVLLESEERYRFITENMSDLVAQVSADRRYLFASSSHEKILGYDPATLIGKRGDDYVHPEDLDLLIKSIRNTIADRGEELQLEYRLRHRSGEYRWLDATMRFFYDEKGSISKIQSNSRDISDRKKAEEALRKSEEEARRLAAENETIAGIGRIVSSSLNIEEVYKLFAEEMKKILPFDRISINLVDANKGVVITEYSEGISLPGRGQGVPFPIEGTMTEAIVKSRNGMILDIQDEKEVELKYPGLLPAVQMGNRSFLSVPMISGGECIGSFNLRSKGYKVYSERDLELAENIASQITEAIANARLFNDLKRTSEELRQSEMLLRNVLDLLPVGVGIADKNGKIISANPARNRIWGAAKLLDIDQYKQFKGWWADTKKKLEPNDWPLARAVIEGETSIEQEIYIDSFDGTKKTVLNSAVPIRNANHEIIGGIGVNQDITERKQAEERLRKSEEHFRRLLEHSSDYIITIDQNRIITYASPSVERIMGYTPEEMIGQEVSQHIHPEDWLATRRAFEGIRQSAGVTRSAEQRIRHQDGTWQIHQVVGRSLQDDPDKLLIILNGRDVTQAKMLERQLSQAQKLEAVGQLAAGIAHEINTPTQYVGDNTRFFRDGFKDLQKILEKYNALILAVKEGKDAPRAMLEVEEVIREIDLPYLNEEIPKAIEQTLEGVERVTKIVRAMKEFSHPGTKEKTFSDLNKAIENTITVSRNEWKYVAEMVTELDSSLPLVPCLLGEINQAILNMIINAAHAIADVAGDGGAGKGTIKVSTRRENGWAEVRISDTGVGIPENIRSRIFDPFFTTKKVGKGTGQGLAIAHSVIVEKHGGTINFESEVGKGTTFIIRLPLADGARGQ